MVQYTKSTQKQNLLLSLNIIQLLFGFYIMISNNINGILWVITLQLFINVYIIDQKIGRLICLPNIFIIVSYIFHISKIYIENVIGYEYTNWNDGTSNFVFYFSEKAVISALKFYFFCMLLLYFGVIQSKKIKFKSRLNKYSCTDNDMALIGTILTMIGVGPKFIVIYQRINARISGGYINTYNLDLTGIGGLSLFYTVGIAILIYASDKNIIRARGLIIF
ncbi:MAG: hypothetical protein NC489_37730, partial [Ruminococcus flavefaciens]|nr:hypothetical protein [Ruminococcus flavefaciens]